MFWSFRFHLIEKIPNRNLEFVILIQILSKKSSLGFNSALDVVPGTQEALNTCLLNGRIFLAHAFLRTKYSNKNRYWDYRLRVLSLCLRDFLWQQRRYFQSPFSLTAWSPSSLLASGAGCPETSACLVLPKPLQPGLPPFCQSPTYSCFWLLGHLTFLPPALSHHPPSVVGGDRCDSW